MSSKLIDNSVVNGIPDLPPIGYYNKNNLHSSNENNASTIKTNLEMKCSNIGEGLFQDKDAVYNSIISDNNINIETQINQKINNDDKKSIKNQINYLACQLASARSRIYNSSNFDITSGAMGTKQIFDKFSNISWIMVLVFCLSMYFLIQGFFSSFDVTSNLFNVIFEELWNEEWFAGGYLWKWFIDHERVGGFDNHMFTPQNKPAESIIRANYLINN